jgi:glyoxylase-like metal-dependent hydrolase (beta-lactamase superfamily II)
MTGIDRRSVLKAGLGGLAAAASLPLLAGAARAQSARVTAQPLSGRVALITGAPGNLVALDGADGIVLVDSGAADLTRAVQSALGRNARVRTLFNTHYHADQTGGNATFGEDGATIVAHEITRQWLSSDYYVPAEDRWVEAPPAAARPTETFRLAGEMNAGAENIGYGYLLEAHTRGDIYVHFRNANVLAIGDAASPLRDPAFDWFSGGWLGGRVDAMDDLLELADDETRIVPAYGPVMNRAELQAERDMMLHLYDRTRELIRKGHSAQDMLDAGVLNEVSRTFEDPYRFLYDVSKSLWAHYTNIGADIV